MLAITSLNSGTCRSALPATLRARFIGGTYHKQVYGVDPWNLSMFRSMRRGLQVQDDLAQETPPMARTG